MEPLRPDPPGRVVLHFGPCPWEKCQGLVRPLATQTSRIVLMCDEEGTVWLHPSDLGTDSFFQPEEPDWALTSGDHITPGTTRWATDDEVRSVGWERDLKSQ